MSATDAPDPRRSSAPRDLPDGDAVAYVSLGSNLGDRDAAIAIAVAALRRTPGIAEVVLSPVFETDPVGPPPQGPYLNAAARIRTTLAPRALLDRMLAIEAEAGRTRGARNAARTLDLDLLVHGESIVDEPGLQVPHPRMRERAFVLEPLAALAPELAHPVTGERIEALARRVRDPDAVRRRTNG